MVASISAMDDLVRRHQLNPTRVTPGTGVSIFALADQGSVFVTDAVFVRLETGFISYKPTPLLERGEPNRPVRLITQQIDTGFDCKREDHLLVDREVWRDWRYATGWSR